MRIILVFCFVNVGGNSDCSVCPEYRNVETETELE